jgi:hypothetical protein
MTGWWLKQPLWKILVSWGDDIPNIWKTIKKCLKPPTRYSIIYIYMMSIDFLCKWLLHMIDTTRAVDWYGRWRTVFQTDHQKLIKWGLKDVVYCGQHHWIKALVGDSDPKHGHVDSSSRQN